MHKALRVVDVFLNVCEDVNSPTLAALARTCKTFHGPAIQMLWRTLASLAPLIMLFPQDVAVNGARGSRERDAFAWDGSYAGLGVMAAEGNRIENRVATVSS